VDSGKFHSGPVKEYPSLSIVSVAVSPDGKRIASGSGDRSILVWSAESGNVVAGPFKGHSGFGLVRRILPEWKTHCCKITGSHCSHMECRRARHIVGRVKRYLRSLLHTRRVNSVTFSPDGKRITSGSDDESSRVWDAESGRTMHAQGPFNTGAFVTSVAFSPNGRYIVSCSGHGNIQIRDARNGKNISRVFEGDELFVHSVTFPPDGNRIASDAEYTIRVWDMNDGWLLQLPSKDIRALYSPPLSHLMVDTLCRGPRIRQSGFGAWIAGRLSLARSEDILERSTQSRSRSQDKTIRIWDADTSKTDLDSDINTNWTVSDDEWIHSSEKDLLLWVPPDMRDTVCRARCNAVLHPDIPFSTRVDFTDAALGRNWQACFS